MSACQSHKRRSHSHEAAVILDIDAKMKLFIFSIACALLQVSHTNPLSHWTLLPHILVVEVDGTMGQLALSCLESPEELMRSDNRTQHILWMKNGEEEAQRGNTYLVQLEESLGGGNYTCHGEDGSLLNHTVVLVKEDETKMRKILVKTDQEDYLRCFAQNYNGEFQCSWTWHRHRVGKVAFIRAQRVSDDIVTQCSVGSSSQHWTCSSGQSNFICSVDDSGNKIVCTEKQHCPYAEESQQILVTVFVQTEHFLVENYSKQFFLTEIVKPDKVRISKVNSTMIEWTYPSSWSSPFSYFPLTFQIALFKQPCKRCSNICTDSKATEMMMVHSVDICHFEIKRKTKAICIRAKDALCNSPWSEWSHFGLRKNKKNKHQ